MEHRARLERKLARHDPPRPGRPHHLDRRLRSRGPQLDPAARRDPSHTDVRGPLLPHGFGAASRTWHHYVREHVLPEPGRDRPVLYNSWEATGFDVDEAGQIQLAQLASRVGAELFVLDDGWFGTRRDDRSGLGDWTPRQEAFPRGLRPLADEVHRLGMDFGLWVEPEMVNRDSELYRSHPDWVLHSPGSTRRSCATSWC